VQPLDSFRAFYGTRRFITEFTRPLHLYLARPVQSTPPHPICTRSILMLYTHRRLGLPSGLLPSDFPTNNIYTILFSRNSRYMPRPPHFPGLHNCNYTWRRAQITAPHYEVFSTLLSLHLSLAQIFSSAPFSQTPSVYGLPLISETKFHTHTEPRAILFFRFSTADEKTDSELNGSKYYQNRVSS
jgi:hypothetical protein